MEHAPEGRPFLSTDEALMGNIYSALASLTDPCGKYPRTASDTIVQSLRELQCRRKPLTDENPDVLMPVIRQTYEAIDALQERSRHDPNPSLAYAQEDLVSALGVLDAQGELVELLNSPHTIRIRAEDEIMHVRHIRPETVRDFVLNRNTSLRPFLFRFIQENPDAFLGSDGAMDSVLRDFLQQAMAEKGGEERTNAALCVSVLSETEHKHAKDDTDKTHWIMEEPVRALARDVLISNIQHTIQELLQKPFQHGSLMEQAVADLVIRMREKANSSPLALKGLDEHVEQSDPDPNFLPGWLLHQSFARLTRCSDSPMHESHRDLEALYEVMRKEAEERLFSEVDRRIYAAKQMVILLQNENDRKKELLKSMEDEVTARKKAQIKQEEEERNMLRVHAKSRFGILFPKEKTSTY